MFSARKRLGNTLEKHWKMIHREKPAKHDFRRNRTFGKPENIGKYQSASSDSDQPPVQSASGRNKLAGESTLRIDKVRLGKSTGDFRTKGTSEDSPKTQGKSAFGRPLPAGPSSIFSE